MSGGWLFDTPSPWTATVPAAPKLETYGQYFEVAVPTVAAQKRGPAKTPCIVVARVSARPAQGRTQPGGPKDRAKGLMDALHDDRKNGPKYRALGVVPPLANDHGEFVQGLAVEVQSGSTDSVEYRVGPTLQIAAKRIFALDVCVPAPNDIDESARLVAPRKAFAEDLVRRCDHGAARTCAPSARCLVVRHRPQRDEDNTWATWVSALTGGSEWSRAAWSTAGSPFSGWSPMAIASVADQDLQCEVRYEVYG